MADFSPITRVQSFSFTIGNAQQSVLTVPNDSYISANFDSSTGSIGVNGAIWWVSQNSLLADEQQRNYILTAHEERNGVTGVNSGVTFVKGGSNIYVFALAATGTVTFNINVFELSETLI